MRVAAFLRWGSLGVCARTPQPVIALLNRQIGAVVQSPSTTPEELAKILAETYEQTAKISKEFWLQL